MLKFGILMEIGAKYTPQQIESKWYDYWIRHNFFHSTPDGREPYTIVIPPPNVTGVLHMGHMLNETIQDVLVRRARMQGKNACWVPGTDHASIATEAKVVQKLKADGIDKNSLTREEFLKHAWQWKEKHGGIILNQLRKLGASCDWERTKFTMDPALSESVIKVFVDLYKKGKIYRGVRMVNWDPAAQTALSDEEVIYRESQGKLYYLRYKIEGTSRYVVVATTRPETILGDTALCVNPNDPRYRDLPQDARVLVPLIDRSIPVIRDEYVDIEFGTGALKVTPAHDVNDYMLGEKYNLEIIDIFNDDGTLNEHGERYAGMDRFEVRRQIEKDLADAGLLEKVEAYTNKVGYSERTNVPIEPKLSMQWFLKMTELAQPALKAVMEDEIRLVPAKFKNTYRYWMENVKDWCISRQLWWGQQIPAYFLPKGGYVVAETPEEALKLAREKTGDASLTATDLRRDPDVLDTWFSSWLWPISVFDGINRPENEEIKYYYPTNDLVTGPDILFFWVARMIIAGYEYRGEMPFRNVYLTGIVRDKLRRKMSKSLGNFLLLRDILETTDPAVLRMLMLQTHYRSPLDFSDARLQESAAALERLENFVTNALWLARSAQQSQAKAGDGHTPDASDAHAGSLATSIAVATLIADMKDSFTEAMDDDFNTAAALGAIFSFVSDANTLLNDVQQSASVTEADVQTFEKAAQAVVELMDVLGISIEMNDAAEVGATVLDDEESAAEVMVLAMEFAGFAPGDGADPATVKAAMAALLDARANARANKNYAVADAIRDGLAELGFRIEDTPQGARIVKA